MLSKVRMLEVVLRQGRWTKEMKKNEEEMKKNNEEMKRREEEG